MEKNNVNISFENGEYARWIKEFQRKNPDTISFSNKLSTINKIGVKVVSLKPLKIEAKDISSKDFENLGLLVEYFDYIRTAYHRSSISSFVISVDDILYEISEDKSDSDERVIRVVDIKDDTDVTPIFRI